MAFLASSCTSCPFPATAGVPLHGDSGTLVRCRDCNSVTRTSALVLPTTATSQYLPLPLTSASAALPPHLAAALTPAAAAAVAAGTIVDAPPLNMGIHDFESAGWYQGECVKDVNETVRDNQWLRSEILNVRLRCLPCFFLCMSVYNLCPSVQSP